MPPFREYHAWMRTVKRVLLAVGLSVAGLAYVWAAAVRAVPGVRSRKAQRRAERERASRS